MDLDESSVPPQHVGARLGNKVSLHKLETTDAQGKKVRTHPRYNWRCSFVENGKRVSKYFKTRTSAEEWAETRENEALAHGTDSGITAFERSVVVETRAALLDLGVNLRDAVSLAIDYYQQAKSSCTVRQLADLVVASRIRAGLSERHTQDLRSKLKRFCGTFGDRSVATVTRQEIDKWLHDLKLSAASFNSFRRILVLTFNDAKRDGHLVDNPAEKIRQSKVVETEVGILTPVEAAALLVGADPEIRSAIALGLFAGLRRSEIERLDWSEIHLKFGNIQVKATKAKSARSRLVPISENLAAWLRKSPRQTGSVWPPSHQRGRKLMEAAHRAAGYGTAGEILKNKAKAKKLRESGDAMAADKVPLLREWPDNALRHSYATYHLAHHENAAALALHLGHTNTALIFAHYRLPVTKEVAAGFWAITPENAGEIARDKSKRAPGHQVNG